MKGYAILIAALLLTACDWTATDCDSCTQAEHSAHAPPPGSNQVLRAPLSISKGLEVIISDVVIPANATVPRHYHPGEEYLYVIEGSAVHVEAGKADRILKAGDAYAIPPRAVHAPRGGPNGARAVVFRVHVEGEEERVLVEGD